MIPAFRYTTVTINIFRFNLRPILLGPDFSDFFSLGIVIVLCGDKSTAFLTRDAATTNYYIHFASFAVEFLNLINGFHLILARKII